MDRREFIKRMLLGGAAISFLPGFLSANGSKRAQFSMVNVPGSQDHVRHGMFTPLSGSALQGGPDWLTHFRHDRFLSNGYGQGQSDMVHLGFGLGGKPMGITLKGKTAFVTTGGDSEKVAIPAQGRVNLFSSRLYQVWLLKGAGNLEFPEGEASELFYLPLESTGWVQGWKATAEKGVWGRQIGKPEIRHASDGHALVLLKHA